MAIGKTTIVAFSFFLLLCPYVVKSMAADSEPIKRFDAGQPIRFDVQEKAALNI